MNRKLLILGAGMFGMVVKEIAEEMGTFEQISFLDDTFGNVWPMCDSRNNHIGKLEDYLKFPSVGDGSFIRAGAIVDHNSIVRDYCNIQCGSVVMPGAVVGELTKTQPNEVIRKTDK